MPARQSRLSRLWAHEKASYGLRVFIALASAVAVCWQFDALTALPGVFLGIIASAIAGGDMAAAIAAGGNTRTCAATQFVRRTFFSAPQMRQPQATLDQQNAPAMSQEGAFD